MPSFPRFRSHAIGTCIAPDIRSSATILAALDIINVGRIALLEERQKLVLGPVKTARFDIGLGPHDEIDRGEPKLLGNCSNRRIAAPVDESG